MTRRRSTRNREGPRIPHEDWRRQRLAAIDWRASRLSMLRSLVGPTRNLRWSARLLALVLDELYVDEPLYELLGTVGRLRIQQYPQAIALALVLRHSWRRDDFCELIERLGIAGIRSTWTSVPLMGAVHAPGRDQHGDAQLDAQGTGLGGFTIAYCARSRGEVDAVISEALRAGATLLKAAQDAFWGGYSGYFADPDGFPWEVAWQPAWRIGESGDVSLR